MRRLAACLLIVTLAGPASAADRLLTPPEANAQTHDMAGRPYWELLARCAGLYGAKTNQLEVNPAHAALAEDARRTGLAYLTTGLAQLQTDRGLERPAALAVIAPVVQAGREEGARIFGMRPNTMTAAWAQAETACADLRAAYGRQPPA